MAGVAAVHVASNLAVLNMGFVFSGIAIAVALTTIDIAANLTALHFGLVAGAVTVAA